jgi:hypothetical protein
LEFRNVISYFEAETRRWCVPKAPSISCIPEPRSCPIGVRLPSVETPERKGCCVAFRTPLSEASTEQVISLDLRGVEPWERGKRTY